MGLKSGEEGGRYSNCAPRPSINRRSPSSLCAPRLSRITMWPGCSLGPSTCSTKAKKTSPSVGDSMVILASMPSSVSAASTRRVRPWPAGPALQREVRLPSHLFPHPGPDRSRHPAFRPVLPASHLNLPGLAPPRRQLLRPTLAYPNPLCRLFQTYSAAVVHLDELTPQIIRVRFWHLVARTIAASRLQPNCFGA